MSDDFLNDVLGYRSNTQKCGMGRLLHSLPEELANGVTAALDNPGALSTGIAEALKARGYQISDYTIARHRRRACACEEGK